MSSSSHAFLALFAGIALIFPLLLLGVARLWVKTFQAPRPGPVKNSTYECGLPADGEVWIQFKAHYYLYAILFLIFDVETVFLMPFAAAFLQLPISAFLALMVFLFLLVEGLVWAWAKGILAWR